MSLSSALTLIVALGAFKPTAPTQPTKATIDTPYEEFRLANGLRVVVHTDRKAPIVAVNVWYHVGSKDEPAGRSGFAHLFEHLMYNGSENHPGEYFVPFELVGATDMNGTTWLDRTNYFQNVPTTALEMALWMESDRMGHFVGAIDQATLDEQRGVVQNEKRQGENEPYGQAEDLLYSALYPAAHPYHHSTIGSMNDLNAASLDDVKTWFRAWYGPNNAVLVLAGDIDVATAKREVTRFFGDIPPGPVMRRVQAGPVQAAATRSTMTDKVPQARILRAWSVARFGAADLDRLQLLRQLLGGGKSSRLNKRLLFKDKTVDSVSASIDPLELASTFKITADVKEGVDPQTVEAAIDEELRLLLKDGPTAAELEQARTVLKGTMVRSSERIGGFGGKADTLAECAVYTKNPGCFRDSLMVLQRATASDIKKAGQKWLGRGGHTLVVLPGERTVIAEAPAVTPAPLAMPAPPAKLKAIASNVDRKLGVPVTAAFPDLKFPALQRAKLKNGTTLVLAERHDVPLVQMSYRFPGGFSADVGRKPGTANFTIGMLDEGAGDLDALAFGDRAEALGAQLSGGASLDSTSAHLSALKENLPASLALFADMVRRPRFDAAEIERVRASWIAAIKQEKAEPRSLAMRVLPPLLYGVGHPYAIPFSGTGTEASVAALTRDDLVGFHRDSVRPDTATLIVVGDTTLAELVPLLDGQFGDWVSTSAARGAPAIGTVARATRPRVFLVDQPGAVQATIMAGVLAPPSRDEGATRLEVANAVLGGEFSSRLNMNLREDKHWAYGSYSFLVKALGQRPWIAFAPVQIDKTAESMRELQREIGDYVSGKAPPLDAEVAKIRSTEIRGLPGSFETGQAVLGMLREIVGFGRADDYVFKRAAEIEAMTPALAKAAATTIDANALTWIVVGDLKQIEAPVRALKLGDATIVDTDGKPVGARR